MDDGTVAFEIDIKEEDVGCLCVALGKGIDYISPAQFLAAGDFPRIALKEVWKCPAL